MKKIFIGICGLPRCIDLTIYNMEMIFIDYEINYYLCLSKNFEIYEKEYTNINFDINKLMLNKKIKKILLIEDEFDNEYRNSLNYLNKINNLLSLSEIDHFDSYIIIRSDLIINENMINKINDGLYFSSNIHNSFIKFENKKINHQIIISNNYKYLMELKNLFEYALENNNFPEIIMFEYLSKYKIKYNLIDINYKLYLSKCHIIAISGDSGSGKTTLSTHLEFIFDKNILKFETDRYHKWERGNSNYNKLTHLDPEANYLQQMNNDIYNLKIGNDIYAVDYDHNTGKFTPPSQIQSKEQIILCGLHTLYTEKLNDLLDLKIYMDTDRELIKKWKIERDMEKRGYTEEKILEQINRRDPDYKKYIEGQKNNADIIINFYEKEDELKCNFIVLTNKSKFINIFVKYNYKIKFENDKVIVELKNNIQNFYGIENFINDINDSYYSEILLFIILSIKN